MKRKALFLDRDGVINVDFGYVHRAEQCKFIEGVFDLVRQANEAGYLVIVVTNQAGIGRGYYTEEQFHSFMRWMRERFAEAGATIDAVYHCPHHPDAASGEYRQACVCRKPLPGMLDAARDAFDIDMQSSVLIGDKGTDMEAGMRASVGRRYLFASEPNDEALHGALRIGALREVACLLKRAIQV